MISLHLKYLLSLIFLLCVLDGNGQKHYKCSLDIDSLFQSHFLSLDTTIRCAEVKRFIQPPDRDFVYMIAFLSGITFDMHSYSSHPQLEYEKLLEYKKWYIINKDKIKCETILYAFNLLRTEIITEDIINALEKLKIE